jgi:hypothetical protein
MHPVVREQKADMSVANIFLRVDACENQVQTQRANRAGHQHYASGYRTRLRVHRAQTVSGPYQPRCVERPLLEERG